MEIEMGGGENETTAWGGYMFPFSHRERYILDILKRS
jgi:hypothetical protein